MRHAGERCERDSERRASKMCESDSRRANEKCEGHSGRVASVTCKRVYVRHAGEGGSEGGREVERESVEDVLVMRGTCLWSAALSCDSTCARARWGVV